MRGAPLRSRDHTFKGLHTKSFLMDTVLFNIVKKVVDCRHNPDSIPMTLCGSLYSIETIKNIEIQILNVLDFQLVLSDLTTFIIHCLKKLRMGDEYKVSFPPI